MSLRSDDVETKEVAREINDLAEKLGDELDGVQKVKSELKKLQEKQESLFQNKLRELQDELENVQNQLRDTTSRAETAERSQKSLEDTNRRLERDARDAKKKLDRFISSNTDDRVLRNELEQRGKEIEDLQRRCLDLQAECREANDKAEKLDKEKLANEDRLSKVSDLEEQLKEASHTKELLEETTVKLNEEASKRSDAETLSEERARRIEELGQQLQEALSKQHIAEEATVGLSSKLTASIDREEKLKGEISTLTERLAEKDKVVESLRDQLGSTKSLEDLQMDVKEKAAAISKLTEELELTRTAKHEAERAAVKLTEQRVQLFDDLDASKNCVKDQGKIIEDMKARVASLETSLDQAMRERDAAVEAKESAESKLAETGYKAEIDSLNEQIAVLKQKLQQAEENYQQADRTAVGLSEQRVTLRAEFECMRKAADEANSLVSEKDGTIEELEKQLRAVQEELRATQLAKKEVDEALSETGHQKTIADLQEELKTLKDQYQQTANEKAQAERLCVTLGEQRADMHDRFTKALDAEKACAEEIEQRESRIKELDAELKRVTEESVQLEEEKKMVEAKLARSGLHQEIEDLLGAKAKLEEELTDLINKKTEVEETCSRLSKEHLSYIEQLKQEKSKTGELESVISDKQIEISKLQEQLESAESEKKASIKLREEIEWRLSRSGYVKEIEEYEEKTKDLQAKLDAALAEKHEAERQVVALSSKAGDSDRAEESGPAPKTAFAELETKLSELQSLMKNQSDSSALEQKVKVLEAQLQSSQDIRSSLQKQLEEAKAAAEETKQLLQNQLQDKEKLVEENKKELDHYKKQARKKKPRSEKA